MAPNEINVNETKFRSDMVMPKNVSLMIRIIIAMAYADRGTIESFIYIYLVSLSYNSLLYDEMQEKREEAKKII